VKNDERPPPIAESLNVPLKVVSVFIGYVIYRSLLDDDGGIRGPLLVAAGFVCLAYVMVNRWTTWRRDRSELIQTGTTILGAGLLVLGALLTFTG
jgi:hypothetical protein